MPSFSQRKGLKPLQKLVQIDSIDPELRNRLWNALYDDLLIHAPYILHHTRKTQADRAHRFACIVWGDFFKQRSDAAPPHKQCANPLRQHFEKAEWNEVYDLMEFSLLNLPTELVEPITNQWNRVLEEENAGYRIIDGEVVEITATHEIAEIEQALSSPITAVQEHIRAALACLSDRSNPSYRNAIKEAISAVESVSKLVTGEKTLGAALKTIRDTIHLHPTLEKGFNALYGYTSDEGGIRHALLAESTVDSADARFMLVACSAFVNFVIAKASEAGIEWTSKS
jgi:AbiJ N-terminal domain 4